MENVVLWVAKGIVPKEMLHEAISSLTQLGELNEEVKLKLAEALTNVSLTSVK
jgi:hypothetical protein